MEAGLVDMHVHLGWFADARAVADGLREQGAAALAVTVTPEEFERIAPTLSGVGNVAVGVGAHPWWIADGRLERAEVRRAAALARHSRYVGEIGLDFSAAHVPAGSEGLQVDALRTLLAACDCGAREQGERKLLSLHSVRAAGTVLDLLEDTGCLASCRCVFHWFSGTSDELHRAVRAGCLFSVNEMMLATRRGREYARQLPLERLLTETDLPPEKGSEFGAHEVTASLGRALGQLGAIRGSDIRKAVANQGLELLGL